MKTGPYQEKSIMQATTHDPLQKMLAATFDAHTATIPLDNPAAIVQILQERCHYDILYTVSQTLNTLLPGLNPKQHH